VNTGLGYHHQRRARDLCYRNDPERQREAHCDRTRVGGAVVEAEQRVDRLARRDRHQLDSVGGELSGASAVGEGQWAREVRVLWIVARPRQHRFPLHRRQGQHTYARAARLQEQILDCQLRRRGGPVLIRHRRIRDPELRDIGGKIEQDE